MKWNNLSYWKSGEYQVVRERLADAKKDRQGGYVPARNLLFRSLDLVPFDKVRVVLMGQDPYPTPAHATGVAFSVPEDVNQLPPTLVNIFKEYQSDLHYPAPKNGDLTPWCEQGVLLWNAYPSTVTGFPGRHHWCEWALLTEQILGELDEQKTGLVFVLLGNVARSFSRCLPNCMDQPIPGSTAVRPAKNVCLETSHPSPLGAKYGFLGSRIFTRTNSELVRLGQQGINWRLP